MRHLHKLSRTRKVMWLVGVVAGLALGASFSLAKARIPAPRITAQPAKITARSTIRVAFTDKQRGVSFVCSLDGSKLRSCRSPVTYRHLAARMHTFVVRASAGGAMSAASVVRFTVDRTPPQIAIAFPSNGGSYSAHAWSLGCPQRNLCGSASDPSGIGKVLVSIRNTGSGKYWDGRRFASPSERYLPAAIQNVAGKTARWSFAVPVPADGSYQLRLRATDRAGNQTAPRAITFLIDATAPPAPILTATPANPTTNTTADFSFADAEAGTAFLCSLDGATHTSCTASMSYSGLARGTHTFSVHARDAAGNASPAATYSWAIQAGADFAVVGDVPGSLYPGGEARSIPLILSNPNDVPIHVTSLVASVQSTGASGCEAGWFEIAPASIPSGGITIPTQTSVTLPTPEASPPSIRMLDSHTNQDACQGAHLTLSYSGSAHS